MNKIEEKSIDSQKGNDSIEMRSQKWLDDCWEIVCRFQFLLTEQKEFQKEPSPLQGVEQIQQRALEASLSATQRMANLEKESQQCAFCGLEASRSLVLFGQGDPSSPLLIVAPAPTQEDDECGELLHGKEGAYLEKWFDSIHLNLRKDCYLTSLVKCMTPGGRIALPDEIIACMPYLKEQAKTLKPKAIVALGPFVFSCLTGRSEQQFDSDVEGFGKGYSFQGIEVIPLYHPATVLNNLSLRRAVWNVLNYLKEKINGRN